MTEDRLRELFESTPNSVGHRTARNDGPAYRYERDKDGNYTWPAVKWAWEEWKLAYAAQLVITKKATP